MHFFVTFSKSFLVLCLVPGKRLTTLLQLRSSVAIPPSFHLPQPSPDMLIFFRFNSLAFQLCQTLHHLRPLSINRRHMSDISEFLLSPSNLLRSPSRMYMSKTMHQRPSPCDGRKQHLTTCSSFRKGWPRCGRAVDRKDIRSGFLQREDDPQVLACAFCIK
ncbi:hypothetical protein KCU90_g88, partial [Aureobasidium melanogenum]